MIGGRNSKMKFFPVYEIIEELQNIEYEHYLQYVDQDFEIMTAAPDVDDIKVKFNNKIDVRKTRSLMGKERDVFYGHGRLIFAISATGFRWQTHPKM